MKVLVSGATGFVGFCVTERCVADGHEVHVLSRQNSQMWRLRHLLPDIRNHHVDLRDAAEVRRIARLVKPDIVFHLATYGGFSFQRGTQEIFGANLHGTINLVDACAEVGFSRFVNVGSSSEYGIKAGPMNEGDRLDPVGDYAVAKAAAALFCRSAAVSRLLPIITLRLFSPFGPWDDPARLISHAVVTMLRKQVPRLSNPAAVRDYIFIDDVVDALVACAVKPVIPGETYNVGSGRQHSICDVVDKLRQMIPDAPAPEWNAHVAPRPEPAHWVADIEKITVETGWEPKTSLADGLRKTVSWMADHLEYFPAS